MVNVTYYGPMGNLLNGSLAINTDDITSDSWDDYFHGTLNLMKDYIETDLAKSYKIDVNFGTSGYHCRLTIEDFFFNVVMWYMVIRNGDKITPGNLFFNKAITQKTIKKYIDSKFIMRNREHMENRLMNNIIDDTLHNFMSVDAFSAFLSSTINLEDFIELMDHDKRFNELMHIDLGNVPLEDVKDRGMEYTNEVIKIIENSKKIIGYDHCLADSFRAQEGTNAKQFKEFAVNEGSKPDGNGGAHPIPINSSYLNGGLNTLAYQFIDSAASRYAQFITKDNVGKSGDFARTVGLNCINTVMNDDPEYDCHTENLLELHITSAAFLKLYRDRWYRLDMSGTDYLCKGTETELIGRTLYFHSPETCASEARGHGICFKCYGPIAYTNRDIKPGKMSAELFTAKTTQERLSAKHLLETMIKKFKWNNFFDQFIDISTNALALKDDIDYTDQWCVLVDPKSIILENEDDYVFNADSESGTNYNEYVTKFYIGHDLPNGQHEVFEICGDGEEYKLYISNTFNGLIRSVATPTEDGMVKVKFSDVENSCLFFIKVENNDLGKSLTDIQRLLDIKSVTEAQTLSSLTQQVIEAAIEGNLGIMAIHYEVIIANQIRHITSNIHKPNWSNPNEPYRIFTLKQSLMDNPSTTVTLLYRYLDKVLYYPLTFQKDSPSFMDLFFMVKPQTFMKDKRNIKKPKAAPHKIVAVRRIRERNN